jgi:hypothetical protein
VPIAAELDGAPDLADERAMQALVPFVRLPVVGIGEPDRAVLALGMDAMLAGSEYDFQAWSTSARNGPASRGR